MYHARCCDGDPVATTLGRWRCRCVAHVDLLHAIPWHDTSSLPGNTSIFYLQKNGRHETYITADVRRSAKLFRRADCHLLKDGEAWQEKGRKQVPITYSTAPPVGNLRKVDFRPENYDH